ncbi:hypothetical protein [Pseudooceanicola sp.]|uniref:hypothetical protein n=1 Tax=Pseudooceanicola sp. TaxID=1914328 RepID=UPI0040589993
MIDTGSLEVRQTRLGYAVFSGRDQVSRDFSCEYTACGAATRLEVRSRSKTRPCICCGDQFLSTGPGHRMCNLCRPSEYRAAERHSRAVLGLQPDGYQ